MTPLPSISLPAFLCWTFLAAPAPRQPDIQQDARFGQVMVHGDFNGDNIGDLAVGIPEGDMPGLSSTGRVLVIYGDFWGFQFGEAQVLERSTRASEEGDNYGAALVVGRFNGDLIDDLAIGIPGARKVITQDFGAGAVEVWDGGSNGLSSPSGIHDIDLPSTLQLHTAAGFGSSLAAVRNGGSQRDALAIGAPGLHVNGKNLAGGVFLLPHENGSVRPGSAELFTQDSPGMPDTCETGDFFGKALASGDFDSNGYGDLVIGVPEEDFGHSLVNAGMLHVLYGFASGLNAASSQVLSESQTGPFYDGREPGDRFGFSLMPGDFNGDGTDDLAVGLPYEDFGLKPDAGSVHVFYGRAPIGWFFTPTGLQVYPRDVIHQNTPYVGGAIEAGDLFGWSLAAGDLTGDAIDDLGVGAPGEAIGTIQDAGAVNVLAGSQGGVVGYEYLMYFQSQPSVPGVSQPGDRMGESISIRRFDLLPPDDLAMGIPGETIGSEVSAGAISVRYMGNSFLPHDQYHESSW